MVESTIDQLQDENLISNSEKKMIQTKKKSFENNMLSQAAITIFFSSLATLIFLLIKMILDLDISKIYLPLLAFPLNFLIITIIYPAKFTGTFGNTTSREFRLKIGFSTPDNIGKNILLGVILALCTLSGLLIGSFLSKEFTFDLTTLTIKQIVFATVPGVWEEVFYRGCLMIIFINWFKDVKKAIIVQSIIFGLAHLSGFGLWEIIDTIFVMILGFLFTYTADRTNSLVPGIIFHFLHDAFIFVVQAPFEEPLSDIANIIIFGFFLLMIIIGFFVVKIATQKGQFTSQSKLYDLTKIQNK